MSNQKLIAKHHLHSQRVHNGLKYCLQQHSQAERERKKDASIYSPLEQEHNYLDSLESIIMKLCIHCTV